MRSRTITNATKYILKEIDLNSDKIISYDETKSLDLRLFAWSWGAVSSIKSSMSILKAHDKLDSGVRWPKLHGFEICSYIKIRHHLVMDPVITSRIGGGKLEIGKHTSKFTNFYQQRKGKAIVRDFAGKQIALASGGLIGNSVIGISIPIVNASSFSQLRVDTDARYSKLSIPFGTGTIKNEDGNHTFMPYILDSHGSITW